MPEPQVLTRAGKRPVVYLVAVLMAVSVALAGFSIWEDTVPSTSYFIRAEVVRSQQADSPAERVVELQWSDPDGAEHSQVLVVSAGDIEDGRVPLYVEEQSGGLAFVVEEEPASDAGGVFPVVLIVAAAALFALAVVESLYGFGLIPDRRGGTESTSEERGFYWRS